MPIKFDCPSCHKKLSVSEAMAGRKGKCPGCQNPLVVPLASTESTPDTPRPSGPRPAGLPTPARSTTNGSSKRAQPASPPDKPEAKAAAAPPPLPPSEIDAEAAAAAALADEPLNAAGSSDIEFECDFCSHPIKLTPDQAGKRIPCPECRRIIKVPEPKKEKKDWRQSENGFPSGARLPNEPVPAGSWGGTATSRASKEALEEAGALPSDQLPLTLAQRIIRIASVLLLVVLLGWGGLTTYRWWVGRSETAALQASLKYAAGVASKEVPIYQGAALHLAAVDYYRGTDVTEANKQFGLGYNLLAEDKQKNLERDLLLIDLALVPFELAGSKEQVDEGRRISWEEAQKQTIAALKAIHSGEARLEGLRQVVRRLKTLQEVRRVIPITARVFEVPAEQAEALSQVCLLLTTLGESDEANKAGTQALQLFEGKKPPEMTASSLAVAEILKKKPKETTLPADTQLLAKSEALARTGDLDGARKEANSLPVQLRLQAWLTVVSVGVDGKNPNQADLEAALTLAESRFKKNTNASWLLFRLVELGRLANGDEERLTALAQGIADGPLQGRAQLDLLRDKLAKLTTVAPDSMLESVNANSLSRLRAHLDLARHNTRRDSSWPKTLQSWEAAPKAFGQLGQALGMRSE